MKQKKVFFSYVEFIKKNVEKPSENVLYLARSIELLRIGIFGLLDQIDVKQKRLKELLFSEREEFESIKIIRDLSVLCMHLTCEREKLAFTKDQLWRNIPETIYCRMIDNKSELDHTNER